MIFVSSIPEDMKEDIQIKQNNAIRCCFNIIDPKDADIDDLHKTVNIHCFKNRLVLNLLLCIGKCSE